MSEGDVRPAIGYATPKGPRPRRWQWWLLAHVLASYANVIVQVVYAMNTRTPSPSPPAMFPFEMVAGVFVAAPLWVPFAVVILPYMGMYWVGAAVYFAVVTFVVCVVYGARWY